MKIQKLNWGYEFGKGTEAEKINEIIDVLNTLTLDEKKEECEHKYQTHNIYRDHSQKKYCMACNKDMLVKEEPTPSLCLHCKQPEHKGHCWISNKEPKSTLREEIRNKIFWNYQAPINTTEEIISLFKDTLLKEIDRNFNYTVHCPKEKIIKLIKNS